MLVQIGPATLIFGDCRDHVDTLRRGTLIATDPPYGMGYQVNERGPRGTLQGIRHTSTAARAPIQGDDEPFDPRPWLGLGWRAAAFCGANWFAERLPGGTKWIVWDKRVGSARDDHSDGELIWTSVPGPLRIHRQLWRGICRAGEENCSRGPKLHPNQKPVALLDYVLQEIGARQLDTVTDPYMGSGSMAVAALRRGLAYIGAECDWSHFCTAACRLEREWKEISERAEAMGALAVVETFS